MQEYKLSHCVLLLSLRMSWVLLIFLPLFKLHVVYGENDSLSGSVTCENDPRRISGSCAPGVSQLTASTLYM